MPLAQGIKSLIPKGRGHLVAFSFGAHVSSWALTHLPNHLASFTITGCAALGLPQGPGRENPREMEGMSDAERMDVHRGLLEVLMFKDASKFDPHDSKARAGLDDVAGKAEDLFQTAYVIRDRDPREAIRKFKIVVQVTDAGSTVHEKAKNQLAAMAP